MYGRPMYRGLKWGLMSDFEEQIREFTQRRLGLIRKGRGTWPFAESLKRLSDQAAHEYEDRFLLELLQNASDAQAPETSSGRVRFHLQRRDESQVLYVANTGRPFHWKDVKALSNLALSSKAPGEGIGNKGLGFRSVLRVAEWPEVFSNHPGDRGSSLGYCFGFARPDDLPELTDDPEEVARLEKEVPPSALPVPRAVEDAFVDRLLASEFVTVIRLPLSRPGAFELVRERLLGFLEPEAPPLLFLDRISSVEVTFDGAEDEDFSLERVAAPASVTVPDEVIPTIVETSGQRYVVFEQKIDADTMAGQIDASINAGDLSEEWQGWEGAASVGVAVSLERPVEGRLYTYLPMSSRSPIKGHINAPFYTKLARLDANLNVALNDFLMDQVAQLAAATADGLTEENDQMWRNVSVDLVSWDSEHGERFKKAAATIAGMPRVPSLVRSKPRWSPLDEVLRWPETIGPEFFTPDAVSKVSSRAVIDPAVGQERLDRLEEVAADVWELTLEPNEAELGEIAERIAGQVFKNGRVKKCNEFYRELASLAGVFGAAVLQRRKVLLDQSGRLRRSGPWDEMNAAEKPVFLPPVTGDGGPEDGTIQLPASLASVVPMLHPEIKLLRQEGSRRVRTEISEVLRRSELVREYRRELVLQALAQASVRARVDDRRTEILEQLFRLYAAGPRGDGFTDLNPKVPTSDRWRLASDAVYGEGWPGTMGAAATAVVEAADDLRMRALSERLLVPPEAWPFQVENLTLLTEFLGRIGVTDGLEPYQIDAEQIRGDGSTWIPQRIAEKFPLSEEEKEVWIRAVERNGARPSHPYTPYRSGEVWGLAGHLEVQQYPTDLRLAYARLVAHSVGHWKPEALEFRFRRFKPIHRSNPDLQRWPSPAAAFLSEVPWVPVTGPGIRDEVEFVTPREGWYFDDPDRRAPAFATLVEGSVARVLEQCPRCRERLAELGLRFWSDPDSAHERLTMLAGIVQGGDLRDSDVDAIKKAVRDAVADCLEPGILDATSPIVVQRGHQLGVAEVDEVVYLPTDPPGFVDQLLESLDIPVAVVNQLDPGAVAANAPDLAERFRAVSDVTVEVVADGTVVHPGTGSPTLVEKAAWLVEWLLLTSELSRNKFLRLGSRALEEMVGRLRRVRVLQSSEVYVRVDGRDVDLPLHLSGCVPLHDDRSPLLVAEIPVRAERADALDWSLMADAADALAELVRQPRMASELRLSATEIDRVNQGDFRRPQPSEWAQAMRAPEQRVREVLARARANTQGMQDLLVPVVYVWAGAEAADALRGRDVTTEKEIEAGLLRHFDQDRAKALMEEAQRAGSLGALRDALGIEYANFNRALEALGPPYAPIHDREEHIRATQRILAQVRPQLLEALRLHYLPVYDDRGNLEPYVEAKRGPTFEPRHEDLIRYASPPEEVLLARVGSWLTGQGYPQLGEREHTLPEMDVVRSRNLEVVRTVLPEVSALVQAWRTKQYPEHGVDEVAIEQDGEAALDNAGWLDFRVLDREDLPGLLQRVGLWPERMPQSLEPGALDLTQEDLDRARELQTQEKQRRRQRQSTVSVGTEEVDAENEAAVAEAVRRTVDDRILQASKRLGSPVAPRGAGQKRSKRTRGPYRPSNRGLTDAQRNAVGLAGEIVAFHWLKAQYEEATDESWVSGNRSVVLGGEGDDSLGYDFIVHQRSQSIRFEVKATAGDETAFELTENEMRTAQTATTRTPYRIIFIRNVLDPEQRSLDVLPNPFGQEGRDHYRMKGRGVQFAFDL